MILAAALGAAAPAAAATDRGVAANGPVAHLATTGYEVACAAAAGRCHEVRVWHTADRGVRRYGRHCFAATSTGSGVAGVAVSQGRALWLTYTGGNIREWSLWTATRRAPAQRRIRFVARDVDAPPPLVLGGATDEALPYAVDRTVVALRPNGARIFAWEAPERVTAIEATGTGYAVVLAGGDVVVLNARGEHVRRHDFAPGEVRAAVITASGLLVHLPGRLLVRLHEDRTLPLPPDARLAGFAANVVAYASGQELRLLRLRDGRDVQLRRLAPGFHADLHRLGVGYASGSRVSWVVRSRVLATLG